jgi:acetyl esterase/lipase
MLERTGCVINAAPARTETVEVLPSTYIDVGGLDIFRDEDVAYASHLIRAGISTELHMYPGVPHAFEAFAPGTSVANRAVENR